MEVEAQIAVAFFSFFSFTIIATTLCFLGPRGFVIFWLGAPVLTYLCNFIVLPFFNI